MAVSFPRPGRRIMVVLDLAVAAWTAAWIVLGLAVADQVRGLTGLSRTIVVAGLAIEETGELVGALDDVPFVGERVEDVAERVRQAGQSARESGRSSRESTENLSVLLGVSIALIPTLPLVALYGPLRVGWIRESRHVRRALQETPDDPFLEEFLARRAVQNLSYPKLREVSPDPWGDLAAGRYERLAERELERLGVRRPERPRRTAGR